MVCVSLGSNFSWVFCVLSPDTVSHGRRLIPQSRHGEWGGHHPLPESLWLWEEWGRMYTVNTLPASSPQLAENVSGTFSPCVWLSLVTMPKEPHAGPRWTLFLHESSGSTGNGSSYTTPHHWCAQVCVYACYGSYILPLILCLWYITQCPVSYTALLCLRYSAGNGYPGHYVKKDSEAVSSSVGNNAVTD